MARYTALLATIGIAIFPLQTYAACYNIDGTETDDTMQPCDPSAKVSACCATNKGSPDICLSSGLCYAQEPNNNGLIYSNGCTDPTGKDDACPHICPDRTNNWDGGSEVRVWNVLQCNAGRNYCCRSSDDSTNCCNNSTATGTFDIGTLILPTKTATVSISGTSAVTTITGGSASTQSCSAEATPTECPKDNAAVVGGAVGGGLGAALLASLGVIAVLWRRRKQVQAASPGISKVQVPPDYGSYAQPYPSSTVQELDAQPVTSELGGSYYRK